MIKRVFLDWDELVIRKTAGQLLIREKAHFKSLWVIVPTESSRIRLSEEMLRQAGGESIPLPRMMTAESLAYSHIQREERTKIRWMQLMAWVEVLRTIELQDFPVLFRTFVPERSYTWACSLGERLSKLRQTLAEGRMTMEDVLDRLERDKRPAGSFIPVTEVDRWRDLVRLERQFLELLSKWGVADLEGTACEAAARPAPYPLKKVILLCHPDPMPLALSVLETWSDRGLPVETWIHAPEEWADTFDKWGSPLAGAWEKNLIPLTEGNNSFSVSDGPEETALSVVRRLAQWQADSSETVLGICDPGFTSAVESALKEQGWTGFRAEGDGILSSGWGRLWKNVQEALENKDVFAPLENLVRLRLVQTVLKMENGFGLASRLDEIRARHLPETGSFAGSFLEAEEKEEWDHLIQWLERWQPGQAGLEMLWFVEKWLAARGVSGDEEESARSRNNRELDLAGLVGEGARLISDLEERGLIHSWEEAFLVMNRYLAQARIYGAREEADVDMLNWLELEFSSEPYLALIAFQEGCVPAVQGADPFLPEKFRRFLGLRGTGHRLARDSFLLNGLIQSRRREGGVFFALSRFSVSGEPCLPSSLLMRCPAEELPARVMKLFPRETGVRSLPAPSRGEWILSIPDQENKWADSGAAFSPSLLNSFLQCPFRFWLRNVCGFDRLELSASVPANELGNVIHKSMEEAGKTKWKDCADGTRVVARLKEVFDAEFRERFGTRLSLPLTVQYELGMKRMEAAGYAHAASVRDGWHIVSAERAVSRWPLAETFLLNMRVDCVQEHESGKIRILDYKSSRKAKSPEEAHYRRINNTLQERLEKHFPEMRPFEREGTGKKTCLYRWTNVQLPLYALWARTAYPGRDVSVGYFNIPLNLDAVGIETWENLGVDLLDSAREWSLAVMRILREGRWDKLPSAEALGWSVFPEDDFLKLAGDGLERAFGRDREKPEQ